MRQLVLVVGGDGQLGQAMTDGLGERHEVVACTRAQLDITDASAARRAVATICPDVIVNCAAYTDVDGAERNPLPALAVNAWAVRTLARLATEIDATLVHFSTDFVFDGETDRPYVEDDLPNPKSFYAVSKLIGEWLAAETPRHFILRVESLFGGPRARSSVDKLLDGLSAGREVRAFADRTVSPSFVDDVVAATRTLLEGDAFGLYHCVNTGWTTWATVARELKRLIGATQAPIVEVAMADVDLLAPRPKFAALSNAKLSAAGVAMPTWQDALARYVHVADRA
jgi:dTDP-4-dehydrorhamnose reductase